MALRAFNFTTGPATLLDAGTLSYNGCIFSPLFATTISGKVVEDNARRTRKLMEYTLTADGYVTLPAGEPDINRVMTDLRTTLTAQGGQLIYQGRGMDLIVNSGVNQRGVRDVAWGPVPELLEFQPLGAGRSAKVRWAVKVRVTEFALVGNVAPKRGIPLLQFNYETEVQYGEDGYCNISVRGTLEVAMTRTPNQGIRTLTFTADDARPQVEERLMSSINLSRFRITRRNFAVSRDKRTLEWDFFIEETPYMKIPEDIIIARGTYNVRPAKAGLALMTWLCTLRCTYTMRPDRPRRVAWFAFLAILRHRMREADNANIPELEADNDPKKKRVKKFIRNLIFGPQFGAWVDLLKDQEKDLKDVKKALLLDFSFDEGLYLDSKTISFSATWRIVTTISHILLASGLWTKVPEKDARGQSLWAASVKGISGAKSWVANRVDPKLDIIVDFGGG